MPYEICTFEDGDLSLSYEVHGTGDRVLVYLHGLLLDAAVNRRLARDLAEAGNRVILLDLPGHGLSDKPLQASAHRMDAYGHRVVHLLDHLGIERAVVGGMSLGADVTLQVGVVAPERLQGMIVEMPVLERATPVAAMIFTPLLALTHYASPLMRGVSSLARRVSRQRLGPLDQFWGPLLLKPEEMVAVLHGVLVGPVAPSVDERARITAPTLVISHSADWLHPHGDAMRLSSQLPDARLVKANSIAELRFRPERLTAEIASFLDRVWDHRAQANRSA